MRTYHHLFLYTLITAVVAPNGCNRHGADLTFREVARSNHNPKVIAAFQPWFGDSDHIKVGYVSNDPAVIHKQIQEAKKLGIYAFAVDWYGSRHPFLDRSYALIQQIAEEEHFHVALMYDETEEDDGRATEDALEAMASAYTKYISPQAPAHNAYLLYEGRPVLFIFPKRGNTDWNQVRQTVSQWKSPPLLLYKDDPPPPSASAFDGEYAWVHPGPRGWATDGSDWGEDYLETFYHKMQTKHPDQIAVGTVWPGFDDRRASWSLNRHISQRCGRTLQDTLRLFVENNPPSHPMPFVLIATWNDYEEGTAIENGLERCTPPPPSS
jgi:hypothetical protein